MSASFEPRQAGDVQGVSWVQGDKIWIRPVVSEWIMKNYPDLLPNHGWFRWTDTVKFEEGSAECVCGEQLPPRHDRYYRLFLHVVDVLARELSKEQDKGWVHVTVGKITWFDAEGNQTGYISADGGLWMRKVGWDE